MPNPFVPQGTLNRVRCSVVIPAFPNLNITSPYMGKSFARIQFQGSYAELIGTATGGVQSPEPYVMANISIGLLRTQALASSWQSQALANTNIGDISVYSDSAAFPTLSFANSIINDIDPGAFDGTDPVVRLTLKGIYYINADMWNL